MKKTTILLCGLLLATVLPTRADNDRAVTMEQLPRAARQFIAQYFPGERVAYAKREREFLETKYEVVLIGSAKMEFRGNGEWKEIDCRYTALPAEIVPEPVRRKVRELYPEASIVRIERDRREVEVKLDNRVELTFDNRYNLMDIDR